MYLLLPGMVSPLSSQCRHTITKLSVCLANNGVGCTVRRRMDKVEKREKQREREDLIKTAIDPLDILLNLKNCILGKAYNNITCPSYSYSCRATQTIAHYYSRNANSNTGCGIWSITRRRKFYHHHLEHVI